MTGPVRELCTFQVERMTPRVEELVAALCDGVSYSEGSLIPLEGISD